MPSLAPDRQEVVGTAVLAVSHGDARRGRKEEGREGRADGAGRFLWGRVDPADNGVCL